MNWARAGQVATIVVVYVALLSIILPPVLHRLNVSRAMIEHDDED